MKYFLIIVFGVAIVVGGIYFLFDVDLGSHLVDEEEVEELDDFEGEIMDILSRVEGIESLRYDVIVNSPEEDVTGTFWQKGEKIKMEGEVEDQEMVVIIDNEEGVAYVYMPAEGLAVQVSLNEVREVQDGSIKSQAGELSRHEPVIIGQEVLDGKECVVVEYTTPNTEGKMWVWKEYGLPIKAEIEDSRGITVMSAENISFEGISDDVFMLPEGVEPAEMPSF